MLHKLRLRTSTLLAATCLIPALALHAQQAPPDTKDAPKAASSKEKAKEESKKATKSTVEQIKEEGMERSHVMETLSHLTDVIGPRLTNSPAMKQANEWTKDQMSSWGMENAHLEPWGPFGRGWTLKRFSAQVVEPQCIPLIAYPKAWSPGTEGTIIAPVVLFDPKTNTDYDKFKGKIKGSIVLTSAAVDVPAKTEPYVTRMTDADLLTLADASEGSSYLFARGGAPGARRGGAAGGSAGGGPRGGTAGANTAATPPATATGTSPATPGPAGRNIDNLAPGMRERIEVMTRRSKFLLDEGAAAVLEPSTQGDGGTLFVAQASVPGVTPFGTPGARRVSAWDKEAPKMLPQIVVAKEHYNRLVRMAQQGVALKIAVDMAVQFHDEDLMGYNTIAEIPGTDLKEEVVMLGGHMDSWHSGTGATDNAAGVAVAMEAARIIKALDLKPRRTIRVALWSGEEQGLLGSRAYVVSHFGKAPAGGAFGAPPLADKDKPKGPTPEFEKFSAYFNLDNGSGKIRGIFIQGNEAVRPTFRTWLQPFREMGAATISIANTGSTDHVSFDGIGLPAFQFIQDPVDYTSRTHHSNQDLYDRVQADDMKQAAVIMASFVYNTANVAEKLPRKPERKTESSSPRNGN